MTYALKDDGTAFFGGDGGGRIYLNGINATIYSANWIKSSAEPKTSLNGNLYQLESEGMKIDLASGELLIQKNVVFEGIILTGGDFIDHRKIQLNSDGFIISRNHYEKSTPEEDEYKTINLFELKINNKDTADDVFDKISYALRTPDYLYKANSEPGSPGAGMEINLGNRTITSFNKSTLQLGGYQITGTWQGFQCLIQTAKTPSGSNRVLQIGQYYFVELGGHVHCNSITVNYDLNCSRISSSGRVEIHGYQTYGDDNVHYSLACWEGAGTTATRGNIFCGDINCFDVNCSRISSSGRVEIHGYQEYGDDNVPYSLACWKGAGTATRGNIFCGNINCFDIDCSNLKLKANNNAGGVQANWGYLYVNTTGLHVQAKEPGPEDNIGFWVRCLVGGSI